jgi:hypothetical protein
MTMTTAELLSAAPPWLGYTVGDYDATSTALWRLRGDEAATHVFIGTLRGRLMRRREGLFDQFGALLQFPCYFGGNWNAFVDCMRDLDWLHANGFLIVLLDAVDVLADGDPDEFVLLLRWLSETGQSWAQADAFRGAKPFRVVLHTTTEQSGDLRSRLAPLPFEVPLIELPRG